MVTGRVQIVTESFLEPNALVHHWVDVVRRRPSDEPMLRVSTNRQRQCEEVTMTSS